MFRLQVLKNHKLSTQVIHMFFQGPKGIVECPPLSIKTTREKCKIVIISITKTLKQHENNKKRPKKKNMKTTKKLNQEWEKIL